MKKTNKKLTIKGIKVPLDFYNIEIFKSEKCENKSYGDDFITLYNGKSYVGTFYKRNSNIIDLSVFYENK